MKIRYGVIFVKGNWWSCFEYNINNGQKERMYIEKFKTRSEALRDVRQKKFCRMEYKDFESYVDFNKELISEGIV